MRENDCAESNPVSQHAVLVAETAEDGVIGWLHVKQRTACWKWRYAPKVTGLRRREGQRSAGAGAGLLAAAEEWARKHGCKSMSVRSNVIRERAQ